MSTSDERREVAERLREQLRHMRENNCYDEDLNVVDCGNSAYRNIAGSVELYGNFEKGNYVHIVELLADLIDPTCEVKSGPRRTRLDDGTYMWASELSCGHTWYDFTGFPTPPGPPAYCHECGARVVSDDD